MKAAIATHWLCLTCGESGTYDEPDTKTDTGAAAKHLNACAGATISATNPSVLEQVQFQAAQLKAACLALAAVRDVHEARKKQP